MNAIAERTFAAFQFRNFRLYVASQLVSFSGTWMQQLAQGWLVLELTGSGTALGTVLAFQFLPMLLLAPLGGVIADRLDKRRLMMVTQSLAGALALTLGVLTLTGVTELWMVYALAGALGIITAIDNPARQTFVTELVGLDHLTNAITLTSVVINGARALGPAVGGVLIATLGIGQCFIANAVSYVFVVAALSFIDRTQMFTTPRVEPEKGQLRQGLAYAWRTPQLRAPLAMLAVCGLFLFEFNVTFPLLADHTFDTGPTGLAIMETLFGIGAVGGGLYVAASGAPSTARLLTFTVAGSALMLLLAIAPTSLIAYVIVPFIGAALIGMLAVANATLQTTAEPHLRGRVMALWGVAVMGTTPIGAPIVGWVGEHVDPRAAVALGGVAGLGAAAYGWFDAVARAEARPSGDLLAAPAAGN